MISVKRASGLVGLLFLFTSVNAYAATHYFSTSGNNTSGNGTQADPFYSLCGPWAGAGCKTGENKISRGQIPVSPGDTFLFKRGDEWVGMDAVWTINATGAPGNPLTFGAWGDANAPRPIFRGAKTAFELGKDNWTNVAGTPIWYTTGIAVWPQMAAQEETAPGGPSLYGAWSVQGVTNANGWTSNQSMVRGTYFYESATQRFYVWRSDDLKPDHASGRDIYIGVAPNDGTDRLVKVNRGYSGGSTDPKYIGQHYVFKDLHVKMSRGYGFSTSYPNTVYINCLSELNSMEGFLFDRRRFGAPLPGAKDNVMRDSVSRRNNLKQGSGAGQGVTIEAENVWIYDSESYENAWAGFDFLDYNANTNTNGGGLVNCKAHHNGIQPVSQNTFDPNIYIDGGSNITIKNCEVWAAGVDPRGVKTRPRPNSGIAIDVESLGFSVGKRPTNIKVLNTLSYGNMGPAIKIGAINGSQSAVAALSDIQIIGSTLGRDRGDSDIKGYYNQTTVDVGIRVFHFKNISSGLVFKNNIVSAMNTVRAPIFGSKSMHTAGKSVMDFDNNIYYGPGCNYNVNGGYSSGGFFSYNYIENMTIDQFRNLGAQASLRQDETLAKTTITANPLLTNATLSTFDARLQPGSPAVNIADTSVFPAGMSGTTSADGALDDPYNDLGFHYQVTGDVPPPAPDTQAPTVPAGLAAVQSGSQVLMSWSASTDNIFVAGYKVFDGTTLLATVSSAGYTLNNAVQGQIYNFSVKAFDAANNMSSPSNTVTLTVGASSSDTTPPTAPVGLSATVSGTQVSMLWMASTDDVGVASYEIMHNGTVIGTSVSAAFLHNGTAGATYNYTVRAKDAANNVSASSGIVTVTIPSQSGSVPTAPSNLVGNYVNGQVQLSWNPAADHNGYNIYRNDNYYKTVSMSSTSTYDSAVTAGKTYRYKVQAYDASDDRSEFTNEVTITIPGGTADTQAPSVPANLLVSVNGTTADLSWSASTDNTAVTGYQVFQGTTMVGTSAAASYSVMNLTQGQTYSFTVKAYDAANNISATSNSASVTVPAPLDTTPPSAPTGLAAALSGAQVVLTWAISTDNVGVAGYQVFQGETLVGTTASNLFPFGPVTAGQTYSFTVKAYDSANNLSVASNPAVITVPDTTPPSVPVNLTASVTGSQAVLTWQASTDNIGVTGYHVFEGANMVATSVSTTHTVNGLLSGQNFTYSVKAVDAANNVSDSSNPVTVGVAGPAAPKNLIAYSTGASAYVGWTSTSTAAGYAVYRNNVFYKNVTSVSFYDKGVVGSQTYTYKVQSYDTSNNYSLFSNSMSVTMPAGPAAPANLSVTRADTKVTLSWTAASGATGYNIFRDGAYLKSVGTVSASNTVLVDQVYRYKVSAYDSKGLQSPFTAEIAV